jgi:hypothetical protein
MKYLKIFENFQDNLLNWFSDSKVVDINGDPKIMYHGSPNLKDIQEFKPKGNKDWYFFTDSKDEAWRYSGDNNDNIGEFYIKANNIFNPKNLNEQVKDKLLILLEDNTEYLINLYNKDTLYMLDEMWETVSDYKLNETELKELYRSNGGYIMENCPPLEIVKVLLFHDNDNYIMLESDLMQKFIKSNGYDSFTTIESGGDDFNIAVYSPNQIKSVKNNGKFSSSNNIFEDKIFEKAKSPKKILKKLGFDVTYALGNGQEGTVYTITNTNTVIKLYDLTSSHVRDRLGNILNNLKKLKRKTKFKYLNKIHSYKYANNLYYISTNLQKGDIHDYSDEFDIDFCNEFSSHYSSNNFDLGKTIDELINSYKKGTDTDEFTLDKYFDSVTKDLISYYKDIANCQKEISKYGFNFDPTDDNMRYDKVDKRYKCIDYI